jgi:hypothetical protein
VLADGTSPARLLGWLAWSAGLVSTAAQTSARALVGTFDERVSERRATSLADAPFT